MTVATAQLKAELNGHGPRLKVGTRVEVMGFVGAEEAFIVAEGETALRLCPVDVINWSPKEVTEGRLHRDGLREARCNALRPLVEAEVRRFGLTLPGTGIIEDGVRAFAEHAVQYADLHQIDAWRTKSTSPVLAAMESVRRLLKLRESYNAAVGQPTTGYNFNRVVEVFEGTVKTLHERRVQAEEKELPSKPELKPIELPRWVNEPEVITISIADQLLDAWVHGDENTFVQLLELVEELEEEDATS